MKYQALFSSKDKSKKIKCRLLQFLFGALSVKGRSELIFVSARQHMLISNNSLVWKIYFDSNISRGFI